MLTNSSLSSLYLSKCDLINRLSINNLNNFPEINKIVVKFSLKHLNENASSITEMNTQIKGILLLYTLLGVNSFIEYHSEKNAVENFTKRDLHSYYIQKITLVNSKEIQKFIEFLFIENDFKNLAKLNNLKSLTLDSSSLSLSVNVPISIFNDSNEFCSFNVKDVSPKELNLEVNFFVKNLTHSNQANALILLPFWHFG